LEGENGAKNIMNNVLKVKERIYGAEFKTTKLTEKNYNIIKNILTNNNNEKELDKLSFEY